MSDEKNSYKYRLIQFHIIPPVVLKEDKITQSYFLFLLYANKTINIDFTLYQLRNPLKIFQNLKEPGMDVPCLLFLTLYPLINLIDAL